MTNNYSGLAFWRSWHRSFYLWTVKYLYVPLGGRQYAHLSIWPIFTFVALWHDIQPRLLAWGWLICLFAAPELIVRAVVKPRLEAWLSPAVYRHFAAAAAALSIHLMYIANLVGYVIGLDGLRAFGRALLTSGAVPTVIGMLTASFCLAHVELEIRRQESRHGLHVNY
jgi:D-alanyl-lipoteichoic acid acyltransferase DltB (MBOAT superfamily)